MVFETRACDAEAAQVAVEVLSRTVSLSHCLNSRVFAAPYRGVPYEIAALKHANCANELEDLFTLDVYKAAEKITALSSKGWEKNNTILGLWHKVALAVMEFSEHPTKNVASLIIDDQGNLQAFGANRIPYGVPKLGKYFVEGERRNYIVCSERIALARLLNINVEEPGNMGQPDYDNVLRFKIDKLTKDILSVAKNGVNLQNSFILTTAPSCMVCAQTIAMLNPKGVITADGVGTDFKYAKDITRARQLLERHKIPIIRLPIALKGIRV